MRTKSGLFVILAALLLGSIGFFTFDLAFAADSDSNDDDRKETQDKKTDDVQKKQEEKQQEREKKAEQKQQELKDKKLEREKQIEEKRKELETQRAEYEKKAQERQQQLEEKRQEIEKKREELKSDLEKYQEKLSERTQKYEEKLQEIKTKYQEKIDQFASKDEKLSLKSEKLAEDFTVESDKIKDRLEAKSDTLNSRTQKILEKINDGEYMGKKIGSEQTTSKYELTFDSVSASAISNQTKTSTMTGMMTFTTFDSSKSNLKLELESCSIVVDDIPYACGFGKARTVSSGDSGAKDSLVIIAFLEDNLAEEVHSTLKIFVDSDTPINQIEQSEVSILGPQSKLSHLWFLDGSATLTKITSSDETSEDITDDVPQGNDISVTLEEEIGLTTP
jgi:myosin heavy subunit